MRRFLVCWGFLFLIPLSYLPGEEENPEFLKEHNLNEKEENVPAYTLPDPFLCLDGTMVKTAEDWKSKRRPELLKLYQEEMYGVLPAKDALDISYESISADENALSGKAVRREIRMNFTLGDQSAYFDLLIYRPKNASGPVPAFMGLNFKGNQTCTADPGVQIAAPVAGSRYPAADMPFERGSLQCRWPIEKILDAGYALVTGYYEQLAPDTRAGKGGVRGLLMTQFDENSGTAPSHLSIWAWSLSRVLDCVELEVPEIDSSKVIVIGLSRLGKTALWTGVNDERFAAVISNESGCGGAAIARRRFGERLGYMMECAPQWLCKNFAKYAGDEDTLPFDQHELIALIAPRPVYIGSASGDLWADPKGEFLAAKNADPVYRLLGTDGIGNVTGWPAADTPVGKTIRYHVRTGEHDITEYDWEQYIRFADEEVR